MITVKLFGIAKDIVGNSTLNISQEITNVNELLAYLKSAYPSFEKLTSILIAINDEYAEPNAEVNSADEIAIIPPVSGG